MAISSYFEWLETTAIGEFMANNGLAFPIAETVHVIAIALVFGTIAIVDLRLVGLAGGRFPASYLMRKTLHWTWLGFAIAVITGFLMFASNPPRYLANSYFVVKMFALLAAGVNMAVFEKVTVKGIAGWDNNPALLPQGARLAGGLSLLFWAVVIVCGRWIGFTLDPFA